MITTLPPRAVSGPGALAIGLATAALAAGAAVLAGPAALALPVAIAGVVFLVREPFALLTLFVYIGLFKKEAVVQAVPVDATLGLGVLLAGVCFARLASGRARRIPFGLVLTVVVVSLALVVSLAWTSAPQLGEEKATKFLTLTLLAALAPFFLVEDEDDLRRFLTWTVVVAAAAAIVAVFHPPSELEGRLDFGGGGNTIGISRLLCAAALVLLLGAVADSAWRWRAAAAGLTLIVVAAGVGSRGPILSLALAIAAIVALWLLRVPRKVMPVLLVVVAGLAIVPFVSLPETSGDRLAAAARDPAAAFEQDGRSLLYEQAVDLIDEHPIRGVGAAGFSTTGSDFYPHNIFLELFAELGVVTVAVVATAIVVVLVGLYRAAWRLPDGRARTLVYIVTGLFLFNLFAVQFSGDINGNRAFWGILGLAWLVVHHGVPPPRPGDGSSGSRA